jgi:hypothetical protein
MVRLSSQNIIIPAAMDVDSPPRPRTQPSPKSSSAFDSKPLPPTPRPAQFVNGRWIHAKRHVEGTIPKLGPDGRTIHPMWGLYVEDDESDYSQDSPTLGAASQTTLCPGPAPNATRVTSMGPPPRPPRDSVDQSLAAFFPNRDPFSQQPPAARHFDTILDRQRANAPAGPSSAPAQEPEKPKRAAFFSRENLSFARKALQTGRKKPPVKVDTGARPSAYASGAHPERTPYPDPAARPSSSRSHRTSAGSAYSQAVAKVFRRGAARQSVWINDADIPSAQLPHAPPSTPANRANRGSGGSGWYEDDSDEEDRVVEQQRIIPSWSRRAGGPDTPRPPPGHQWHGFFGQTLRTVVMSRDERRRAALREKIRVIPEGQAE